MSQFYERNNKCDCRKHDDDQRASLIKMEVPDYPEDRGACLRLFRLLAYFSILALLGYSLWRIQAIESALEASDRFANITRLLNHQTQHRRMERSVNYKSQLDLNSVEGLKPMKKPTNKNEFDLLVNDLYDKIQSMHNDTDRGNFDRNIKAVFSAWFPVFDALLRHEMSIEEQANQLRQSRSTWRSRNIKQHESDEHSSEELEKRERRQIDMDSDESDENVRDRRQIESDESEEKKKSSEERGGGSKWKKPNSAEVSSEEKRNDRDKNRWGRSAEEREDSVSSSEEKKNFKKSLKEFGKEFAKKHFYKKQSDESSQQSIESKESKEKFYYQIVT